MVLRFALRPAVESPGESIYDPRGWSTLGRETAIQKVYWDDEGWPRIEGGHGGKTFVEGPKDAIFTESASDNSQQDDFTSPALDRTGIPCGCRLRPKWAPPATAN